METEAQGTETGRSVWVNRTLLSTGLTLFMMSSIACGKGSIALSLMSFGNGMQSRGR